jgi:hypothetical protein
LPNVEHLVVLRGYLSKVLEPESLPNAGIPGVSGLLS